MQPQVQTVVNEIDEAFKRLTSHQGVEGYVVVNSEGAPIKTNLDSDVSMQYATLMTSLSEKSRTAVRDLDPANDLVFIRLRTMKHEILVAPAREFLLTVIQNPDIE